MIHFTHKRTHSYQLRSLNFQFVCLSQMKLNCFLPCEAFSCVPSSVFYFQNWVLNALQKCTHAHYSLSSSSHKRYWKVELAVSVQLCQLLSPHRFQVSGSLSSGVKPCRLARFWVVVAMGAGSWAMLPALSSLELYSGCVRKRASLEPGPICLSLSSLFPSPTLLVSDGMSWYECLMPQFPYATGLLCHFAMGAVPLHIHIHKPNFMDQQCFR